MATGNLEQPQTKSRPGRRWLPLILLFAALIAITQYSKDPSVEPVMCAGELGIKAADVVMLSTSWCRYCRQARGLFVAEQVNYCEYDIEKTTKGAALYQRSQFGAIPVIFVGGETVVGFDREEIVSILAANDFLPSDND